jgi:hypothetical protein
MNREYLKECYPDLLILDGFDHAIVGVVRRIGLEAICYSEELVLKELVNQGMSYNEAIEYFEFNIIGAWVGEHTPIFLTTED